MKRVISIFLLVCIALCFVTPLFAFALDSTAETPDDEGEAIINSGDEVSETPQQISLLGTVSGSATTSGSNVNITITLPASEPPEPEPISQYNYTGLFPVDVCEYQNDYGRQIVKTYELSVGDSPDAISRDSFQRGGWRYDLTDITKRETVAAESKEHASYLPPPYGVFSGNIPTNPSSLYHDNTPANAGSGQRDAAPDFRLRAEDDGIDDGVYSGWLPSTSTTIYNTTPMYYNDGSIGTLYIPSLSKTIKVYEGETLENMKKGIGHFESTSAWDGNVALAGHNRGAAAYFSFVKNLAIGDTLVYTTPYGTRTYEVYNKVKIGETDYSGLGWSADNILTLITCVENEPAYRWLVQAAEIG